MAFLGDFQFSSYTRDATQRGDTQRTHVRADDWQIKYQIANNYTTIELLEQRMNERRLLFEQRVRALVEDMKTQSKLCYQATNAYYITATLCQQQLYDALDNYHEITDRLLAMQKKLVFEQRYALKLNRELAVYRCD